MIAAVDGDGSNLTGRNLARNHEMKEKLAKRNKDYSSCINDQEEAITQYETNHE